MSDGTPSPLVRPSSGSVRWESGLVLVVLVCYGETESATSPKTWALPLVREAYDFSRGSSHAAKELFEPGTVGFPSRRMMILCKDRLYRSELRASELSVAGLKGLESGDDFAWRRGGVPWSRPRIILLEPIEQHVMEGPGFSP